MFIDIIIHRSPRKMTWMVQETYYGMKEMLRMTKELSKAVHKVKPSGSRDAKMYQWNVSDEESNEDAYGNKRKKRAGISPGHFKGIK